FRCFNSKMVQFKAVVVSTLLASMEFQFQNGTIQRPNKYMYNALIFNEYLQLKDTFFDRFCRRWRIVQFTPVHRRLFI
ncbi:MAG: hypothetical protein AAF599_05760, partial [Bacteroidota bacterium]